MNRFIEFLMLLVEMFSSQLRISALANQFFLHSDAKTHHQATMSTMSSRLFIDFTVPTLLTGEAILQDKRFSRCLKIGSNSYKVRQRVSTKEDLAAHTSDRTKIVASCTRSANDAD